MSWKEKPLKLVIQIQVLCRKPLIKLYLKLGMILAAASLCGQSPAPAFEVVNGTSALASLSPRVVAVIVGENITPASQLGCVFSNQFGWPLNLDGVQVFVNQKLASIASHCRLPLPGGVTQEVLTCQFPADLASGQATVVVSVNDIESAPVAVTLQSHAPALTEYFVAGGQKRGAFRHPQSGQLVGADAPALPGEVLSIGAIGLGPTDPVVAVGEITPPLAPATVTKPSVEIDGEAVEVLGAALRVGHVGVYDVTFRVPAAFASAMHLVRLNMAGVPSNEVVLIGPGGTGPSINAVVNAASFAPNEPAAPGSILSLFVSGLQGATNTALFPATTFDGLSVTFDGTPAPLFAIVPEAGQINVLAPLELAEAGAVDVRITASGAAGAAFPLALAAASPGIFRSGPDQTFAAVVLANTAWLAVPDRVAQALSLPTDCAGQGIHPASYCGHPLRPGETLQLYLTGLGKATLDGDPNAPPLSTGQVAPAGGPLYRTVSTPQVTIGGLPADVAFSGLAPGFAGLYQINAVVPAAVSPGDMVSIQVTTANGLSDSAMIAVQAP
jgi:uncharacterized protein (TIGR03437 family)